VAKLAETGVKSLQQFNTSGDSRIVAFHKSILNAMIRKFGLSTYQLLWVSFLKGIVLTMIGICLYYELR
jgi:hypothetical protein